jgi:hypothetical protein
VALLLGAATGKRGLASRLSAAGAAYLVNGLALLVGALEIPRKLSLFYYYAAGGPLRHGLTVGHSLVLIAIATTATLIAPAALDRCDLST